MMNATTTTDVRTLLEGCAEKARSRRLDEEGGRELALNGQCYRNALAMSRVLEDRNIRHEVVAGVLVGDRDCFPGVERVYTGREYDDEHGTRDCPAPVDDFGRVRETIGREEVSDVGVVHIWIEVDAEQMSGWDDDRCWVVEPYSEIRGDNEYRAVATPVSPIDYVRVDDPDFAAFDREALERMVREGDDGDQVGIIVPETITDLVDR